MGDSMLYLLGHCSWHASRKPLPALWLCMCLFCSLWPHPVWKRSCAYVCCVCPPDESCRCWGHHWKDLKMLTIRVSKSGHCRKTTSKWASRKDAHNTHWPCYQKLDKRFERLKMLSLLLELLTKITMPNTFNYFLWLLNTRSDMSAKKGGIVLARCSIYLWMHLGASFWCYWMAWSSFSCRQWPLHWIGV